MNFINHNVQKLKAYVYGEQPSRSSGVIKLNTNENPYPPHPDMKKKLAGFRTDLLRLYPDPQCHALTKAASAYLAIDSGCIVFGNGSDELIANIFKIFFGSNDKVLFTEYTYTYYHVFAGIHGLRVYTLPMQDDFKVDLKLVKNYPVKVVFLTNPNSPTGIAVPAAQIAAALKENKNKLFIIDEAYADFADENCIPLLRHFSNLVILRTFSKAFSFCGGRLGYALSTKKNIKAFFKVKDPYNISTVTQLLGEDIFRNINYYKGHIKKIIALREHFAKQLVALGFSVLPSSANFIFCTHPGLSAASLAAYLRENNILVRYFNKPGLKKYLRITIGTELQMQKVYKRISHYLDAN